MNITKKSFGKTKDGKNIDLYFIENDNNIKLEIISYGGIVKSLYVPDKNGISEDIVLGYDTLEEYMADSSFLGVLCGRYANRIKGAKFEIDGVSYTLNKNEGENQLHGGKNGFHTVIWDSEIFQKDNEAGVILTYLSKDQEEGYPGNLTVKVKITINNDNELKFDYTGITDKSTHLNLTHHGYFNLTGCKSNILKHELKINSSKITESDNESIPTGNFIQIKDTPFDFSEFKMVGKDIDKLDNGYDNNYVLNKQQNPDIVAEVFEPESGRYMQMYTTEPGVQMYSSNYMSSEVIGKGQKPYDKYYGLCLEAQHFPNSPNIPDFPSTLLTPGETYKQTTIYKFLSRK